MDDCDIIISERFGKDKKRLAKRKEIVMKTVVKRRPFGNTGLFVSEVGFGAMNLRMLNTW